MPIKGVILVTHNIEEAVLMCDRILVFGSNPGRILSEIKVSLPQPRNRLDPSFRELVESIYVEMTARPQGGVSARQERFPGLGSAASCRRSRRTCWRVSWRRWRPHPSTARPTSRKSPLTCRWRSTNCFRWPKPCRLLRFAELEGGDLKLTEDGLAFAHAALDERKRIFMRHLLTYVPLAAHIRRVLDERASHSARKSRFIDELEDS